MLKKAFISHILYSMSDTRTALRYCENAVSEYLHKEWQSSTASRRTQLVVRVATSDLRHQFRQPPARQAVCGRYVATPERVGHLDKAGVRQLKGTAVSRLQQLAMEVLAYQLQLICTPRH